MSKKSPIVFTPGDRICPVNNSRFKMPSATVIAVEGARMWVRVDGAKDLFTINFSEWPMLKHI